MNIHVSLHHNNKDLWLRFMSYLGSKLVEQGIVHFLAVLRLPCSAYIHTQEGQARVADTPVLKVHVYDAALDEGPRIPGEVARPAVRG